MVEEYRLVEVYSPGFSIKKRVSYDLNNDFEVKVLLEKKIY